MRGHGDLAGRRLCADYLAGVLKGPNDLHAEVNDHRFVTMRRVVVEEAIMTVGAQALMAAEALPDKIKRRLPYSPDVANAQAASHCGERLRHDVFGDNLIIQVFLITLFFVTVCIDESLALHNQSIYPLLYQIVFL